MSKSVAQPPLIQGPRSGRFLASFQLTAADGRLVGLWDYRQRRNLVLYFHHGSRCQRCRAELSRFARYYSEYRERDAEVLAIGPDLPTVSIELTRSLELPFPLLSDPSGEALSRQKMSRPAVIVASRFEEIWAAWAPAEELTLPTQQEILSWLEFCVIQCHNSCGGPEWPTA